MAFSADNCKKLIRELPEALFLEDLNGNILQVNQQACRLLGYEEEKLLDLEVEDLVPEGAPAFLPGRIDEAIRNGKPLETINVREDGTEIPVELRGRMIEVEGEERMLISIRDITERKKAEAELEKSESKFRAIAERVHDGLFIYRGDKFEWVNDRASEVLGYSKEELYQMSIWNLLHPEDRDRVKEIGKRRAEGKDAPSTYEARLVRKDGEVRHGEFAVSLMEYNGEQAVLGAARDITERKKAEEKLEESEEKYRTIFESAEDAIFIMKGDRFVDCNEKTLEMFECEREDIVGEPPYDFSPKKQPDGRASAEKAKEKINLALEGDPQNFEWVHTTKDGKPFPAEVTLNRYMIEDEEFVMAIVRDVTERKKAEEELRENEKKYRQIFNNANDAIYLHEITDEGLPGQFLEVNDIACEMLGYNREEFLTMSPQDIDAGRKAQNLPNIMEDFLAKGHKTFEMDHEAKDGRLVPVEISSQLFEMDGEKRVLSIARDISERKKLQRKQELFSSSLEQASLGIYWIKPDGSFAYTNEKVKEILGYSEEELAGMYVWDVDPNPGHAEDKRKERWTELKEEGTLNFESVHQTKDGHKFPVEVTSTYIHHGGEKYEIAFSKDITERKEAKKELQESEQKFRSYVENAPVGVYVVNGEGEYVEVNEATCEMRGYSQEELLTMGISDLHPPEATGEAQEAFEELLDQGEMEIELPYLKKDGTKGHMVVNAVKISENRYLGFSLDITEKKRAQRKLEERVEFERLLVELSGRFLEHPETNLDEIIDDGLAEIGEFLGVDRTYLYQFDWEQEVMRNTHEWCGKGIEPLIDNSQGTPNSRFPAWMDKLKDLENIRIPSVPNLPEGWEAERKKLEAQNIKSLIAVPISYSQNLLGYAGFDAVREKRKWSNEEIDLLQVFGDLTGSALHLHDTEEKLREDEEQLRQSFTQLAETTSRVLGVRDPYTEQHEQRVADIAREVGKRMGLDEDTLLGLYLGGVLHDVGKIAISESVLSKPGELKEVEWQMIKSHPEVGYNQILADTDFPWPVAEMTLHHHERLDGSGYPDGLTGEELSKEVRILALVDVVEAMSTRRLYREARSKERTLNVIKEGKGEKFDPEVVEVLVEMIDEGEIEFGNK